MLHDLNWIDYVIIGLIAGSILLGIIRGFVREAMSLVTWVAALAIGILYCEPLASHFTRISVVSVRYVLAFIVLALSVLIIGGIISHIIVRIIRLTGFGVTDRIIGTVFGFARGAAIIAVIVLIGDKHGLQKDKVWQSSILIPKVQPVSLWIQERIPEDVVKRVQSLDFLQADDDSKNKINKTLPKTIPSF